MAANGLDKRVAGANARELTSALDALLVVREVGPGFVLTEADVLDQEAMVDLTRRAARLQKLLRAAAAKKSCVLASDIASLLQSEANETKTTNVKMAPKGRTAALAINDSARARRGDRAPNSRDRAAGAYP